MKANRLSIVALTVVLISAVLFSAGAIAAAGPAAGTPAGRNAGSLCLGIGWSQGGMLSTVADLLGLTPDEIAAERQDGKSMTEIAAAQGISEAELTEDIIAARSAALDELVNEGRITKEQADAHLAYMAERVEANINSDAACLGSGLAGGFGGGRMGRGSGGRGAGCGNGWQNQARANQ